MTAGGIDGMRGTVVGPGLGWQDVKEVDGREGRGGGGGWRKMC
jgi:hypothetical protein